MIKVDIKVTFKQKPNQSYEKNQTALADFVSLFSAVFWSLVAAAAGLLAFVSALTIKRSNFMQTSVSHADPVTADMKRSSNKRKVCSAYSFVYCSFHCRLCNFRPNNICRHQRVQILLACCELHCGSISSPVCYTYKRSIKEKN